MKNTLIILMLLLSFSCRQKSIGDNEHVTSDSVSLTDISNIPEIEKTSDKNCKPDFFIISIDATEDVKVAVQKAKELRAKGHPSGYLWMPDYSSLSSKEMFSVFIGPFHDMDTTIKYLEIYKKSNPNAYAVNASHDKKRTTVFGKYDIRVNDVKQYLILIYSSPQDEEAYTGEDWGWFVNDVSEYFFKHYPDKVYIGSVYGSWFTSQDIKSLNKELGMEGFGYVLVNGKSKQFLNHSPSSGIIYSACDFFGLEEKEMGQGD